MLEHLHSGDHITITIFGKETSVEIFSTGDNQFDENGDYKPDGFALNEAEMACLDQFIDNVVIDDYIQAIMTYCNEYYADLGEAPITLADLPQEVTIGAIAINISTITQSLDGTLIYPEIAFCGECACDPEHGICIGFRDKQFLGISSMDWIL